MGNMYKILLCRCRRLSFVKNKYCENVKVFFFFNILTLE